MTKKEKEVSKEEDYEIPKKKEKLSEKDVEDVSKKEEDDNPSWYHYVIIILVLFSVFFGIYLIFNYFDEEDTGSRSLINLYNYDYKIGNVTYKIKFHNTINSIDSFDVPIKVNRIDFLNTVNFTMVFLDYNGTDNGEVSIVSTKLTSFMKRVYHMSFNEGSFKRFNETNCLDSNDNNKVIIFNPYSNRTGVFMDENGCIEVDSQRVEDFVLLGDKFIYKLIKDDNR